MIATINLYPFLNILVIVFALFGFISFLNNTAHIIGRYKKDYFDNKKDMKAKELDSDIIQELIKKFPDVSEEFMRKPERLQNIENNQEIHDIRKQIEKMSEGWKNN